MRNIIISFVFFLFVHCTFKIYNCEAQWVQVSNGMGNISVPALASSGNYLFAGTWRNGVYLSTNNGTSWAQTSLNNRYVGSFAVNNNNIFAGTTIGVYLSTNYSTNWTQTSLNNRDIYSLVANGNNIFAGVDYGVYLSTNNGTNWTQTSLNNRMVKAIAINGNDIFAGTGVPCYGVYLSTNNGTNWTQTSLNNRCVFSLAINGSFIFAGAENGVYLSTNNGTNWILTSLNNKEILALAVNENNIFAGTGANGVFVSKDSGATWEQRNEGLGNLPVFDFCILNSYIFAGTSEKSVYRRPLSELIGIKPISTDIPKSFSLSQNYPNPFNPSTKIHFAIPPYASPFGEGGKGDVSLKVFDILGHEVSTLVNEQLKPGSYEVEFNGNNYPSGVYFYKLTVRQNGSSTGDYSESKKMLLIR
jgi:hypothetical protein